MIVFQLLFLCILLILVPLAVGGFFVSRFGGAENVCFMWVSGQVLLWAVFQVICVPFILSQGSFNAVVFLFSVASILLAVGGILCFGRKRKGVCKGITQDGQEPAKTESGGKWTKLLWLLCGALLLLQLVLAVFLAYEEGDDAYYVAISTITVDADQMYMKLPYTGQWTGLDARHGLAPFPIWVAYLAELTKIPAVTMAQIILPLTLIVMTYGIYFLIGNVLLEKRRKWLPLFMIFVEIMVLFGGYSTYSAENFLLVRTSQGKAVIANIVIPFMIFLLFRMLEALEKGDRISGKHWLLVALTMVVGCLCSTLGSLLSCILLGVVGGCAVVCYRKWKLLVPMAACCVAPAVFALLYLMLG